MTLPAGWDDAAILAEALESARRATIPAEGLRVVDRPGWMQIITTSFRDGGMNDVSLAVLADAEADAVIDATIAEYRALGLRFRWYVGPDSRPRDLPRRLAARGLAESTTCVMARAVEPILAEPDGEVRVDEVDRSSLDAFTDVMARGWSMEPEALRRAHDAIFGEPERRHRLFLARRAGEPVGVAGYVAFPRSAYLLGAVVLPEHRGRGVYGALVRRRLRDAASRELALATSHANEATSAPILARMGFREVCRYPVFSG